MDRQKASGLEGLILLRPGLRRVHGRESAVPVLRSPDRFCIGQPLGFPNFADFPELHRSDLASCLALTIDPYTTNKNGRLQQQTQQLQRLRKRPERR